MVQADTGTTARSWSPPAGHGEGEGARPVVQIDHETLNGFDAHLADLGGVVEHRHVLRSRELGRQRADGRFLGEVPPEIGPQARQLGEHAAFVAAVQP
ncbi:hypothetical protein [Methylobacterium komagatae]